MNEKGEHLLILPIRKHYLHAIETGAKHTEYRRGAYWSRRLRDAPFDAILFVHGKTVVRRPWKGYTRAFLYYGNEKKKSWVFLIHL